MQEKNPQTNVNYVEEGMQSNTTMPIEMFNDYN